MRTRSPIAAAALALAASTTCHAQSADAPSPYIGGNLGIGIIEDGAQELANTLGALGAPNYTTMSRSSMTYRVYGGLRINPRFGIEAGYGSLGEYNSTSVLLFPASGTLAGKAKASAFSLTGNGYAPLSESVSLLVKGGLARWDLDVKLAGTAGSVSTSASGFTPVVGIGLISSLADRLAARAEFEYFFKVGDGNNTGESSVMNFNVGLEYRF